jgi:hypothetical protein
MDEGAFSSGGNNTGFVTRSTQYTFGDDTSNWNVTGSNVANGGHYVVFSNTLSVAPVHGPAKIHSVVYSDELSFYPPTYREQSLTNCTYRIYKLPDVRLVSLVAYEKKRSAA